ncbi:putative transcriptional regulator [Lachnotalea glycerini]|uniref:BlaI/MecI/CopY family transcriptional regulator n=1 Tax=Lachnotalea glycerini TaxID=1763509 RepID=A0A255I5B5_9FIRM|nr:BlaI/MecI/CopY family transcriptional regulator [Lachnotalea glycerini]PXV96101.1 putative transcriptional regulator [Lachnotalea glycerini]RDY29069.1 BlaI/MecI/CopY family transcriptional regulator [Lachnotalea glycerini]
MSKSKLIPLTNSEYEVMKIVWESDHDITLQEVLALCATKYQKIWKRTTVATFLAHIIEKGVATSYRKGRYFYYKPTISEDEYKKLETGNMINFWYDGSASNLVASLCKQELISKEELLNIQKLIDDMD